MSVRHFFDSNIVIYGLDTADLHKSTRAIALLADVAAHAVGVISYQVVQEVINVALHKMKPQMTPSSAGEYTSRLMSEFEIVLWSPALVERALGVRTRYLFRWYDCLIVAAALEAKCDVLYSEDLQHGQRIEGLEIVDPFR